MIAITTNNSTSVKACQTEREGLFTKDSNAIGRMIPMQIAASLNGLANQIWINTGTGIERRYRIRVSKSQENKPLRFHLSVLWSVSTQHRRAQMFYGFFLAPCRVRG